jgi:diguanylate cyclase (GGDEF)-like protein/PAS domain S-box-containing protein
MAPKTHYLEKELRALVMSDPLIFQFIQKASLDGLWYWDLEDKKQEWMNTSFWELLGYKPSAKEHLASEWQSLIFPEDLELMLANLEKHCDDPKYAYDQVVRYRHKDGSTVWVHCRGVAIRDAAGKATRMLGAHTDLTPQKKAEESVLLLNERFSLAVDSAGMGIWDLDLAKNKLVWDDRMFELYQQDKNTFKLAYKAWLKCIHTDDRSRVHADIEKAIADKTGLETEFRVVLPDASVRHLRAFARVSCDDDDKALRMTGVNLDITKQHELLEEVKRLSSTDLLTGVGNRRHFMVRTGEEIARTRRSDTPLTVFVLDIDFFKKINDTYGHDGGDKVLQRLADKCMEVLRTSDIFCRMGGEEFAALLPETTLDNTRKIAERLRQSIQKMVVSSSSDRIKFTACIGIAELTEDETTAEEVLKRADRALGEAKESGRNKVVVAG